MNRFVIVLLLLAMSPSFAAAPTPPRATAESAKVAAFVDRLEHLRKEVKIPGLSFAVVKDRAVVVASGSGHSDIERDIAATAETPYDIASVAKPLSAVVVFRLIEAGTLDLDKPLAEYSEWKEFCTDFSAQPTVFTRELRCDPANHTLRHLLSHTATATPGTRFSYNPVLYSWASRPIMSAAAAPFSALVERHVFVPAGMTMSARRHRELPLRKDLEERLARPYRIDASGTPTPADARSPQGDGAAGGVISTVADLARFDIALDQGTLISNASRTRMLTATRSIDGVAFPYAIGWYVQEYKGHTLVWHSGWWEDAYSALYLKIPELDLSFIVLANSEGIWWDNPLDRAEVERSRFAQAFLAAFVDR